MSSSPTATVQALYAAFGSGDIPRLLTMVSDDIEWTFLGRIDVPYLGTFKGKSELLRWFGLVAENDAIQAFEPREFLAGAEHVTVIGWERTQALPGGGVFECDWVHIWKLREGQVARFTGIYDTAAVAAARAQRS